MHLRMFRSAARQTCTETCRSLLSFRRINILYKCPLKLADIGWNENCLWSTWNTKFSYIYGFSSQQTGSPYQSIIRATTTTCKHQEIKMLLAFRLHLRWHPRMNTLPHHCNTCYHNVLRIISTLACRLILFLIDNKYIKKFMVFMKLKHMTGERVESSDRQADRYLTLWPWNWTFKY